MKCEVRHASSAQLKAVGGIDVSAEKSRGQSLRMGLRVAISSLSHKLPFKHLPMSPVEVASPSISNQLLDPGQLS